MIKCSKCCNVALTSQSGASCINKLKKGKQEMNKKKTQIGFYFTLPQVFLNITAFLVGQVDCQCKTENSTLKATVELASKVGLVG